VGVCLLAAGLARQRERAAHEGAPTLPAVASMQGFLLLQPTAPIELPPGAALVRARAVLDELARLAETVERVSGESAPGAESRAQALATAIVAHRNALLRHGGGHDPVPGGGDRTSPGVTAVRPPGSSTSRLEHGPATVRGTVGAGCHGSHPRGAGRP
jgi:hypothetical protein